VYSKMTTVFFNEIHYENIGIDVMEGVEIAGPAGTNLDGWKLSIYDGSGNTRGDLGIRGLLPSQQNGFGTVYIPVALPNQSGGHALALVDSFGKVRQFISWKAQITAVNGVASGLRSEIIPVDETVFTQIHFSLQLVGKGNTFEDFKWAGPRKHSFGSVNQGQTFVPARKPPAETTEPIPEPTPTPAPAPTPTPTPSSSKPATPQVVQSLDLYVDQNRVAHHTDKLHTKEFFAVRRGQPLDIGLVAPAEVTQAIVKFTVYPETKQSYSIQVTTSTAGDPETEWFGYFSGYSGGKTNVTVFIPGRATVGQYTVSASGDGGKTWTANEVVYVLFNAWSKYDDVFLENDAERNEYVLGEDGLIWVGSYNSFAPRGWSFSQFNTKSFQAALLLLQRMALAERGDVVTVSRNFSALVNSQDDNGVLVGNWSSNFSGGTPPSSWTGSADILKEYVLKGAPVRYAQCWVYSGVLTTVLRAVGIPARSVTNFASAHDTPDPTYNRSVDKYFKADGTEDSDKTTDSVWNFHVWNDAWLARRDLKSDVYTGWQAVDATPQERSGGKYQMGPVPLVAVKNGESGINYDLEFVYSEVNADEKYYVEDGNGGYKLVRTVTDSIGKNMSTKAVGSNNREDVTLHYKYKENTPEERASHGSDPTGGDVAFTLDADQKTPLGQTINAQLSITAKKGAATVKVEFSAHIVTYTGKHVSVLAKTSSTVNVNAGATTAVPFQLTPDVYVPQLKGTHGIVFRAYAWVQDTEQTSIVQREFDFVGNDVAVHFNDKTPKKGADGSATVSFKNPLNIALTNLELAVEGTDLTKVQRFQFASVKPGETITQQVPLHYWASGKKLLIAQLDSAEINDLRGLAEIEVA
jgi:transglutaminase 1